jgi:hypothetical protein
MIEIRPSEERGGADHGWLQTRHSFSFADYHDPAHMGFGPLRVINEDRVAPGAGFDLHPHADMEILSYVLSGVLAHRDSLGHGSVIRPGEVQRMSAGTGIVHSEFNASDQHAVHFLQIWLRPERRGIEPGYEQKAFSEADKRDRLCLVASREGENSALRLHQDAEIYASLLSAGKSLRHDFADGRIGWLQVVSGLLRIGDRVLEAGDGGAIRDEKSLVITAEEDSEFLLFDMSGPV